MTNPHLDTEIQTRISSFLSELSALVKRQALEAVHEALGGAAARRRGPGRPRKVTVRRGRRPRAMAKQGVKGKRIRRSPEDLAKLQANILAAVRSKQGQRLEEIGRAMKTDTAVLTVAERSGSFVPPLFDRELLSASLLVPEGTSVKEARPASQASLARD